MAAHDSPIFVFCTANLYYCCRSHTESFQLTLALYAGQTLIFNFLFLMFCITITSVAYFKLFRIIRRHQQQIQANESSKNFGQPSIDLTKYKKSVFTILCIIFVFYIGYLPMAISLLSNLVLNDGEVKRQIFSVTMMLLFWSSSLNPLLYLWRMKDIRDEVKQLLGLVSSRKCLDAPAILAAFTAGRTGLVACP